MSYDAKAIANYFLELAKMKKEAMDLMKLQKLIYFAHGFYLAIKKEPLLDEQIEAWQYGPVIPSIYHEFKEFGNRPITRPATEFDATQFCFYAYPLPTDNLTKRLLEKVWEVYGVYTGIQLANMTHLPGSPWDKIYKKYNHNIPKGTDIPEDIIKEYFYPFLQKNLANAGKTGQKKTQA